MNCPEYPVIDVGDAGIGVGAGKVQGAVAGFPEITAGNILANQAGKIGDVADRCAVVEYPDIIVCLVQLDGVCQAYDGVGLLGSQLQILGVESGGGTGPDQ